jgi:hypothetical protein
MELHAHIEKAYFLAIHCQCIGQIKQRCKTDEQLTIKHTTGPRLAIYAASETRENILV